MSISIIMPAMWFVTVANRWTHIGHIRDGQHLRLKHNSNGEDDNGDGDSGHSDIGDNIGEDNIGDDDSDNGWDWGFNVTLVIDYYDEKYVKIDTLFMMMEILMKIGDGFGFDCEDIDEDSRWLTNMHWWKYDDLTLLSLSLVQRGAFWWLSRHNL